MSNKKTTGQSLAEFAITLPILIVLVMGIFDFGRAIYYYSTIQNAAHEGARYGAVHHCDEAGIIDRATSMAIGLGTGLTVEDPKPVDADEPQDGKYDYIKVTVTYQFVPVTPLIAGFFGANDFIDLEAEARQLIEVNDICSGT